MEGWSLFMDFSDEPTTVPTGDECEHAERSENCLRTDCSECGREASAQLRAEAMLNTEGVIALACEVIRIQERYSGRTLPEYAVTEVDLSMCFRDELLVPGSKFLVMRRFSIAKAEGVIDELVRNPGLQPGDYDGNLHECAAYRDGRRLVAEYLDITSAAGPQGQQEPTTHTVGQAGHRSGPGFESRAQHKALARSMT